MADSWEEQADAAIKAGEVKWFRRLAAIHVRHLTEALIGRFLLTSCESLCDSPAMVYAVLEQRACDASDDREHVVRGCIAFRADKALVPNGRRPIEVAAYASNWEVVRMLLRLGVRVPDSLPSICDEHNSGFRSAILERKPLDEWTSDDITAWIRGLAMVGAEAIAGLFDRERLTVDHLRDVTHADIHNTIACHKPGPGWLRSEIHLRNELAILLGKAWVVAGVEIKTHS